MQDFRNVIAWKPSFVTILHGIRDSCIVFNAKCVII